MADIGSLVVKLAAETAEFQADLGKSARLLDKHANEMKASLQSVANVAKSAFALAVGVTSVAAIKEFVLQTMEAAAALQGLSEQTGASVEALSGFQAVATISHTTLENIGGSLAKLAKGMAGVDDETAGATKALQFLGVDARDTAGNLRDPAEVMKKPVPPQPEQAAISFRFSGKEDLMNPIVMALLVEQKQAPSPQSMETAEKILKASQVGMQELVPQGVSGIWGGLALGAQAGSCYKFAITDASGTLLTSPSISCPIVGYTDGSPSREKRSGAIAAI